mmetsp:Transcript_33024/g.94919  ORF Transcript_33024/g.94919 Transcript_33024/m.94919 type:complete len:224 (-) Transcript_33024:571-1242(-)
MAADTSAEPECIPALQLAVGGVQDGPRLICETTAAAARDFWIPASSSQRDLLVAPAVPTQGREGQARGPAREQHLLRGAAAVARRLPQQLDAGPSAVRPLDGARAGEVVLDRGPAGAARPDVVRPHHYQRERDDFAFRPPDNSVPHNQSANVSTETRCNVELAAREVRQRVHEASRPDQAPILVHLHIPTRAQSEQVAVVAADPNGTWDRQVVPAADVMDCNQ